MNLSEMQAALQQVSVPERALQAGEMRVEVWRMKQSETEQEQLRQQMQTLMAIWQQQEQQKNTS